MMTRFFSLVGLLLLGGLPGWAQQGGDPVDRIMREDNTEFEPEGRKIPDGFLKDWTMRVRITSLTPTQPVRLAWRYGGEGLGGDVVHGTWSEELPVGEWTEAEPLGKVLKKVPRSFTLTFSGLEIVPKGKRRSPTAFKDFALEFEVSHKGKVVRTFTELGPDGATASIMVFGEAAKPEDVVLGVFEYAKRRADRLANLPWAAGPFPRRYMIVTDLGGYAPGAGHGIRTSNKAVIEEESRALQYLGVNALRGGPDFLEKLINENSGIGTQFAHRAISGSHGLGYPVPAVRRDEKTKKLQKVPEGAGCPFDPDVPAATQENLARAAELFNSPLDEVWSITVDEIGSVFNRAPDGKEHMLTCEHCAKGFQDFVREHGVTLTDLGKKSWEEVLPITWKTPVPAADALAAYYSYRFVNDISARMFTPQRDFFAKKNAEKRNNPAIKRPFVYNYAMRGCTFLRRGGLDFFDFYRYADNAFVYETSNRDPRLWHWDSYLNDVGRVVSAQQKLQFGILIKPHRGAPIQRMLSAVTRSARMLFWYTYGPDYKKGDSFSQNPELLAKTSWAAHLLGKTEDVLYDATLVEPVQVALLRTRQAPIEEAAVSIAVNEDAKWMFTALTHAHIPVDPLDETTVEQKDFSRYKIIYLVGTTLTKAAAEKLAAWVKQGGILYISGYSGVFDEAHRPLEAFGLKKRNAPELWEKVAVAGAVAIPPLGAAETNPPPAHKLGNLPLAIGREVLEPGTETLAKFGDDKPAIVRHALGKGQIYMTGFFGGLEYAVPIMRTVDRKSEYDLTKDFNAERRDLVVSPALKFVRPTVDTGVPTVEGVLMRNPTTGKQAVVLMNWTYRQPGADGRRYDHVPLEKLTVRVRAAGDVKAATSAAADQKLTVNKTDDGITIALPKLAEGDVVLLE